MDKDFYNRASAAQLGWNPSWFGEKHFDDKLVRAIKKWQRSHLIGVDGLCGPATFRRMWTERQSTIDRHKPEDLQYSNYIVYNNDFVPIRWDKVVLWSECGGMKARDNSYYDYTGRPRRKVRYFVNHWDVCLSSRSCHGVMGKKGLSIHFMIDNDGTIYQTLDIQHAAFHAGSSRTNRASIGVEISNAYYPKYQDWYKRNGFGERPIIEGARVHGNELEPFTDFYPIQKEALKALWTAVHEATGVSYETPVNQFGTFSKGYEQEVAHGSFSGFVSHYHISKRKIDCAGLDIQSLLKEAEQEDRIERSTRVCESD